MGIERPKLSSKFKKLLKSHEHAAVERSWTGSYRPEEEQILIDNYMESKRAITRYVWELERKIASLEGG